MNYHLEGDFHNYSGMFYRVLGFGDGNDDDNVLGFDHGHVESFHGHPLHHTTRKLTCDLDFSDGECLVQGPGALPYTYN
jgi:hypothetical protein